MTREQTNAMRDDVLALIAKLRKEAEAAEWLAIATGVEMPPLVRGTLALSRQAMESLQYLLDELSAVRAENETLTKEKAGVR